MNFLFIVFCFLCNITSAQANPFAINFPEKEIITEEDFINIQNLLKAIDIKPVIEKLYIPDAGYTTLQDFYGRCSKGVKQVLLDPERHSIPSLQLVKIGSGSEMCIVSTVPFNKKYISLIKSIPENLEATGFNGYFLYQIGGFPNPSGREIQYVGVPYCFKIFMMLEAYKLGFNKVLWVDSAVLPLRDPTPLFSWLDENGALIHGSHRPAVGKYLFPATHQLLQDLTGTDVLNSVYICTIVFGLKMDNNLTKNLIQSYYHMVELGTPFLSCFPEEFVLTALIGQADYASWKKFHSFRFLRGSGQAKADSMETIKQAKDEGYFFYHRKH